MGSSCPTIELSGARNPRLGKHSASELLPIALFCLRHGLVSPGLVMSRQSTPASPASTFHILGFQACCTTVPGLPKACSPGNKVLGVLEGRCGAPCKCVHPVLLITASHRARPMSSSAPCEGAAIKCREMFMAQSQEISGLSTF